MGNQIKYPEFPIVRVSSAIRKISDIILTRSKKISTFDCVTKKEDDDWETVLIRIRYKKKKAEEV